MHANSRLARSPSAWLARLCWAANRGQETALRRWKDGTGPAERQSLLGKGRTASHRRAADAPPGPVPTACWAVSSPPSKSVTHGASHIPQLQEIQKASAPAFLQLHMPPLQLSLKYFCSRTSLLLPSLQPRGEKNTLTTFLSALRNPHQASPFQRVQQHGPRLANCECCTTGSYLVARCAF